MAPQNSSVYYGVDFEESGGSDLALICKLWGPFCYKPSSIVETPKTSRRSGLGVQMDVVWMSQLVVVGEGDTVPVCGNVEPQMEFDTA